MVKFFTRIFNFVKNYPGILCSLVLIIVIPLTLYYNTSFTVKSFQENIDFNLQTKALMIEDIFGIFAADFFSEPKILQQKIEDIIKENSEITKLRVMQEQESGEFKIIASQDVREIGGIISDPSFALAWSQNQTIANLVFEKEERFWKVIKPIYDRETGKKIGMVSMALSLRQADALITSSIYRSYLIVIGAIILTLFLIIQHTRLFGYVVLSRKLQELDKMKDNFIRMATHELQSPITNIRAYTQVLKEEIDPLLNSAQRKYFFRVEISVKNLSALIYDILEVSRIEQGRLDFTAQKISPAKIINEVIEETKAKAKAEQKNLQLIFETPEKTGMIFVNPLRFKQILANLVGNAVKYTPKGKIEVKIDINEAKQKCVISVRDTGLGISAEAQKRLFERFYRVKTRETAEVSGTGLGLWISKQLCEKMGGKIFIESMAGVGTKFTVVFPLSA